jgi:hypothetical protein
MKPVHESGGLKTGRRFSHTECFFRSGIDSWHSHWPSGDGEDGFRNFHNLGREYFAVSARERAAEMAVFVLMISASAWPVIYMVVTVVKLLWKGRAGLV